MRFGRLGFGRLRISGPLGVSQALPSPSGPMPRLGVQSGEPGGSIVGSRCPALGAEGWQGEGNRNRWDRL